MDTMARRTTKLSDLPTELVEAIAVVQSPLTVCALTIALPHTNINTSSMWTKICARTLNTTQTVENASEALALTRSLTCAWWAANGALVRGVPVHFRRGFVTVRERGSTTLARIKSSSNAACLVMGGPDDSHGAHSPPPALECDFALSTNGPFPVDGMIIRVTGAPVPATHPRSPPSSPLARSPTCRSPTWSPRATRGFTPVSTSPPRLPSASVLRAEGLARKRDLSPQQHSEDDAHATARVLVNGTALAVRTFDELCAFTTFDIELPARILRRKPQMNTLCIEYVSGSSSSALWLRELRMVSKSLPLNNTPQFEDVPQRHVGRSVHQSGGVADKRSRNSDSAYPTFTRIRGC